MKKNFLVAGQRLCFNLSLAADLIVGLLEVSVRHFRSECPPQLKNFFVAPDPFPIAVKFRGEGRPEAGAVYRVFLAAEAATSFRDQGGNRCRSRDRLLVHVYPRTENIKSEGELRFIACGKDEQMEFYPAPKFLQAVHGKDRHGYLWVAEPGVEYAIRHRDQADEVLFEGNVVVETAISPERSLPWSAAVADVEVAGGKKLAVYDRRKWQESVLAHATHVRRTLGRGHWARSFEFITLRDADPEKEASCTLAHLIGEAVC